MPEIELLPNPHNSQPSELLPAVVQRADRVPHADRAATLAMPTEGALFLPAHISRQGENASRRFLEFFAAEIENDNTRATYYRAVQNFFRWCDKRGFSELESIGPVVVAAYIKEEKARRGNNGVQTVKVELAAIRRLFDYLVIGQVMPTNPALSVRGPKHVVTLGKTAVLDGAEARRLIESIPTQRKDGGPDLVGLRDRALISLMTYSLARVSAALKMEVRDYRPQGKRFKVQLHEKGGKLHEVPVHHKAEEYLDAYIEAAGIGDQQRGPLWRKGLRRTGTLQTKALTRFDAFHMIRRRALAAGIAEEICCHTFRATGITVYRKNGGTLADAQQIAGHSSARTTQLYDRSENEISLEEIERIRLTSSAV
jgi:site-specific recombinase XerD